VGHLLVAVPASNEEHRSSIGDRAHNCTSSDAGTDRVDFLAGVYITTYGTAVLDTGTLGRLRVGADRCRTPICRQRSGRQRERRVDETRQIVHSLVLVVPERADRSTQLSGEGTVEIAGNPEQSQSSDEALVLSGIEWLQPDHADFGSSDVQGVGYGDGKEFEDLVPSIIGDDEWVIERPVETNLPEERIRGWRRDTSRGRNHLRQLRRDTADFRSRRGQSGGLLNDVCANDVARLGVCRRRRN
jgi:hypothetical protein